MTPTKVIVEDIAVLEDLQAAQVNEVAAQNDTVTSQGDFIDELESNGMFF